MPNEKTLGARVGSRLPTPWKSETGLTVSLDGRPDHKSLKPATAWATVEMPTRSRGPMESTTRLQMSAHGVEGKRTVTVNRTVKTTLSRLDVQLDQAINIDRESHGAHELRMRTSQTFRVTSPRTRTSVAATASRNGHDPWRTSIAIEQPLRKALNLSARVESDSGSERKARLGAKYHFSW